MTPTPPTPPRRRPSARQATAGAAVLAALAGAAVAGTFACADAPTAARTAAATTTASAQPRAAARPAARVIVKRGLRGRRGPTGRTGPRGPKGAAATDVAGSLSLNWKGNPAGKDTAALVVPGIGRLTVTCNPGTRELRLTPAAAGPRTVLTTDVFSGTTGDHGRAASADGSPVAVPLPVSGLITATLAVEPVSGDGGPGPAPASLTLSVESKSNADPGDPKDFNYCYAAAQALRAG